MSYCEVNSLVPISALIGEVQLHLPGVSATIIANVLRRQATVFVDKTKANRILVYEDAQCNVAEYPVTLPDCLTPLQIDGVEYHGVCYTPVIATKCETASCGNVFEILSPAWIKLTPPPGNDELKALKISVVAGLTHDACELPTELYTKWGHIIVKSALSVLFGMYGQVWFSAELQQFYGQQSQRETDQARASMLASLAGGASSALRGEPWVL